jgi:hypothetical protein
VVPGEVSAARVMKEYAPRHPERVRRIAGKAPGTAPDHVAKGWRSMNSRVRSLLVLFVLTALLGPTVETSEATRRGGEPRPDAVLYEVTEHAELGRGFRVATSALEGWARPGSPRCPTGLQEYAKDVLAMADVRVKVTPRCRVVATGKSTIDLSNGRGRIHGKFWVVVNSDATNLTDAQELVVMTGDFAAHVQAAPDLKTIDIVRPSSFKPTEAILEFPVPDVASFTGTFRLPFTVHHTAVYQSERGTPAPVLPNERALGDPTVRVEVHFD